LTVVLKISKPPAQSAAILKEIPTGAKRIEASVAGAMVACAFLISWPERKRWSRLVALVVVSAFLGGMSGCSHVGSGNPGLGGTSTNSFVATVTASGGAGAQAVSHSVTLAVTVQ
jgi:hypothetical protein